MRKVPETDMCGVDKELERRATLEDPGHVGARWVTEECEYSTSWHRHWAVKE